MAKDEETARYRVLELSFIGLRLVHKGEEIEYDGNPSDNLEPLNAAARAAKADFEKKRRAPAVRTAPARRAANGVVSGDDVDDLA